MRTNALEPNLYAYVGAGPLNWIDPFGLERKPGKTPPKSWPDPPQSATGKKPKWNSEGYWEGKGGRRITRDDRSHGAGVDRGEGEQGGHWDDETSGNRWDPDGNLLPGSPDAQSFCPVDPGTAAGVIVGGALLLGGTAACLSGVGCTVGGPAAAAGAGLLLIPPGATPNMSVDPSLAGGGL